MGKEPSEAKSELLSEGKGILIRKREPRQLGDRETQARINRQYVNPYQIATIYVTDKMLTTS